MSITFIDLAAQQARIKSRLDARINAVLAHGQYIMGPEVEELEAKLAEFSGAKHALTCANGTDALQLALMAIGAGPQEAVFCPSFTFASTAEVIPATGAVPFFVDVEPGTFNMSPISLKAGITHARSLGLRPAGIIPVDLFGRPANYDAIENIAKENSLWIVADSAQGFGGNYKGRTTGSIGDISTTSFFPAKPLGCYGDGGAVFTSNDELADKIRSLRVHGKGAHKYDNIRIGMNSRLDTLQAAILLEKLAVYPDEIEKRQKIALRYSEAFCSVIDVPVIDSAHRSVWAQYTVRTRSHHNREKILAALSNIGIPTSVFYPRPLHQQSAYKNFPTDPSGLPESEAMSKTVFSLPMHPYLNLDVQEQIVDGMLSVLAAQKPGYSD
jgi:dTDP-4-amino-4,6-dideoxygalactose transaminase